MTTTLGINGADPAMMAEGKRTNEMTCLGLQNTNGGFGQENS